MKKLIQGIVDFRQNQLADYRDKYSKLALKHAPDTLFIACCDSRVVPNVFASSDPGDLFVVRNIGNLIPPYHCIAENNADMEVSVAAAIEFSLLFLNVSDVVICGHSDCAAMRSFVDKDFDIKEKKFLSTWLRYAAPSYERFQKVQMDPKKISPHNALSQINVLQQLDHLKTYPWVAEQLRNKEIRIHGWWFDLASADVYHYNPEAKDFVVIDEGEAEKALDSLE